MSQLNTDRAELTETIQIPRAPADSISGQVQDIFREVKVRSLFSASSQSIG